MAMTAFGPVQQSNNSMRPQRDLAKAVRAALAATAAAVAKLSAKARAAIDLVKLRTLRELLRAATKLNEGI